MMRKNSLILMIFIILFNCLAVLANAEPWKFIVYGDTRSDDTAHRKVLKAIEEYSPDYKFIINVGDVVADGTDKNAWEIWRKACEETLAHGLGQDRKPPLYMAVPGNHDHIDKTKGLENWNAYLPGQTNQFGHSGKYFVFDYNNARILMLDSTSVDDQTQREMLSKALQSNGEQWLVAIWHYPIFSFGDKPYEEKLNKLWGQVLYKHGCDIILNGHAHHYIRTKKLKLDGRKNPPIDEKRGTVQVITGNGGAPLYPVDENKDGNRYMVGSEIDEEDTMFYGYTEIIIDGNKMTLNHISIDGDIMDSAVYKPNKK